MTYRQLKELRAEHLKTQHDVTFYDYQNLISDKILAALITNLNVKTAKDVESLKLIEIPIEISRQAGKTEAVAKTVEFIMTFLPQLYKRSIHIGIFAPQIEQARTDFERIKNALRPIKDLIVVDDETKAKVKEQENAKTLVLPNGSSVWIAPVTTTSKPESKTFDLMIFEEAQDIDDVIMTQQIFPIGSTTNAPRVFIGTAGTRLCYYRKLGMKPYAIKIYFDEVVKQRRKAYELTGDPKHLIYEKTVTDEIVRHGLDADEIQRPYFGKWLIGSGQFVTEEQLKALQDDRERPTYFEKTSDCYAGIDVAKSPDSTVVTVLRFNKTTNKKEILSWLELRGDNYQDQFEMIVDYLNNYKIIALAIDATGIGDYLPDMFERNTEWQDENTGLFRVKFSATSKDMMYKNLKVSIRELLTTLPNLGTKKVERFVEQMLDLQQEYKGQLLSVHHPDSPNARDDYPDSWALAEWAYARHTQDNDVQVVSIEPEKEKKNAVKDEQGVVTDYWPGLDD